MFLTLSMVVLVCVAFGTWRGHEDRALLSGISTLVKGAPGSFLPLFMQCADGTYCGGLLVYGIFVIAAQTD